MDEQFETEDLGLIVESDDHPSFFLINLRSNQLIDIGWVDIPGVSRWAFTSPKESQFFSGSLRSIVFTMQGRANTMSTLRDLAELIRQSLLNFVKSKKIVPITSNPPPWTEEEGVKLMQHYRFHPIPERSFDRYFQSAEGAAEVIKKLRDASKIIGVAWFGVLKTFLPAELNESPSADRLPVGCVQYRRYTESFN